MIRVQELCRKLRPVLGKRVDRLWAAYLAEDADGKADVEQMLELLAAKHLGQNYEPDRSPYSPPPDKFARAGDIPDLPPVVVPVIVRESGGVIRVLNRKEGRSPDWRFSTRRRRDHPGSSVFERRGEGRRCLPAQR